MYITAVRIKNFQSHPDAEVKFTKGMNAIVGTSGAGKSVILRAIRWNNTNQPSGDGFISIGAKETEVAIDWSDGHTIVRTRNKGGSKNTYTLMKNGQVVEEYTGFGVLVPQPILDITGVDPELRFDFADQLEAPFLISATPKVRAETIGNMEELGKLDSELAVVNDDMRAKKNEQKEKMVELAGLEKEKNDLLYSVRRDEERVETLRFLREALIEKDKLLKEIEKSKPRLFELRLEYNHVEQEVHRTLKVLNGWDDSLPEQVNQVSRLLQLGVRMAEMKKEANAISYISEDKIHSLSELTDIVTQMASTHQRLLQLNSQMIRVRSEQTSIKGSFSLKTIGIDHSAVDREVERYTSLFRQQNHLVNVKNEQETVSESIKEFNRQIDAFLEEFVTALQDSEMCPTCFQDTKEIDKSVVQEAI